MKLTPLNDVHLALGAKMAEFAGYNMPISYKGIKDEHAAVRSAVGVFDVSHMGEFIVKGSDAAAFIHYFTSNDVHKLAIGDIQYSCFPNKTGGIVDDLLVYRLPEDRCAKGEQAFMLVVNASNIEKDWNWIHQGSPFKEVSVRNISEQTALLAVQGPAAIAALQSLTDMDLAGMKYYTFRKGEFAGIQNVIVSATGYTGSGGFELYIDNYDALALWTAVFAAGAEFGIQPIGLGARDTLRLEKGFCLYGNDIDDTTSPLEAGLGWITKLTSKRKGEFLSFDWLTAQKTAGVTRKLVGFKMIDRGIPRHDYLITDADENPIGVVCSGTQSPTLGEGIGTGYVPLAYANAGAHVYIQVRDKYLKAEVVKLPFL